MKRWRMILLLAVFLTGCRAEKGEMDRALALRSALQNSNGCSFDSQITADYGDKVYTFGMYCVADKEGVMTFMVTEPESITGITGTISRGEGKLTFDDVALAFDLLAEDQITPISGPWILLHTLQGGYLKSCSVENGRLCLQIHDSYREDALQLDIWLTPEDLPQRGEIFWKGRRIVSVEVKNFEYL